MPKQPRFTPTTTCPVELVAFPAVQLLDVAGPLQVFATANDVAAAQGFGRPYVTRVVAKNVERVRASAGLELSTRALPNARTTVDTLIVAGGPGIDAAASDGQLRDWLRSRAMKARRVASVCTGAFLLAEAGLLDGKRVATHWSLCDDLARRFPNIRVEPDPIFIKDGSIWTSAGVTAGIDLTLALVEEDLGRAIALAVARYLVVFLKRPGGQSQYSAMLSLQTPEDRFGGLHAWIGEHLAQDLSLPRLAERAGMSERSFSRHYHDATGTTPARAVERMRVEIARQMLSDTSLPLKRIATRCGFGSEETMRRSFLRQIAVTPQEFRMRFSA